MHHNHVKNRTGHHDGLYGFLVISSQETCEDITMSVNVTKCTLYNLYYIIMGVQTNSTEMLL